MKLAVIILLGLVALTFSSFVSAKEHSPISIGDLEGLPAIEQPRLSNDLKPSYFAVEKYATLNFYFRSCTQLSAKNTEIRVNVYPGKKWGRKSDKGSVSKYTDGDFYTVAVILKKDFVECEGEKALRHYKSTLLADPFAAYRGFSILNPLDGRTEIPHKYHYQDVIWLSKAVASHTYEQTEEAKED